MPRHRPDLFLRPPSKFWQACYYLPDGTWVERRSTGTRDHAAASLWLAAREREYASAQLGLPVAKQIGLAQALAEYLVESDFSPRWRVTVETMFRLEVIPSFGADTLVSSIDEPAVLRFRNAQRARPDRRFKSRPAPPPANAVPGICLACGDRFETRRTGGRPQTCCSPECSQKVRNQRAAAGAPPGVKVVSAATVNRLFWEMSAFGKWAIRRSYAQANPWAAVKTAPEDQLDVPDIDAATWASFILAIPIRPPGRQVPYRLREVLEFAREVGLRKGELGRLAWTDFDLEERIGWIVSSHQRGHTKAKKGRPFALSRRAVEILIGIDARGRRRDGLVFGPIGSHRNALSSAAAKAGLPRAWIHLMRHLGASAFASSGATAGELQAFGGWSSMKMAERYTKTRARRLRELLDRRAGEESAREAIGSEKKTGGPGSPGTARHSY